jgi:S1-C subfamily serine protease
MFRLYRTVLLLVLPALALVACATPYQPKGWLSGYGYEDEAVGKDEYHINVTGNRYTSPGTLEEYFIRRAKEIVTAHGYDSYHVVELTSGYERGPFGLRPAARGIIVGLRRHDATAQGGETPGGMVNGTGIVVSADGIVLTNQHVVPACRTITIRRLDGSTVPARLVASDKANDLAILKAPLGATGVAAFRDGPAIRQGVAVVAVGFPLPGVLSVGTTMTTGTVSALAGMGNDSRFLQVSVPVQPGNSGGPLLDQSGNLVGVIESGLNAVAIAAESGVIPQNVNFAIKSAVARSFLEINAVAYRRAASTKILTAADIGDLAKSFTLTVRCAE